MSPVIEQMSFVGDLVGVTIEMLFDEFRQGDSVERGNEQFVVSDHFVSYTDLVKQFGKRQTDRFIERAIQNAR